MEQNNSTFKDKLGAWGNFFKSPYFIKNICIYIGAIVLFFVIVVQGLKWYTRHSEKISVPAVEGMVISDAQRIIRERGLVPQIIDCTYTSSVKPGVIIPNGQQPIAGYPVKKGRTIFLTYMAYTKEPTSMPRIIKESVETAKSELIRCGLVVGKITEKEWPYKGQVLEARLNGALLQAGKELHKGDVIDLWIGKGKEDDEPQTNFDENLSIDTDEF